MSKGFTIFGWKNVLRTYGCKSFLLDSILPIIVSSLLCIIIFLSNSDIFAQLKHLVGIGIAIIPTMVALTLTAYTIMLSFIISDKFAKIKEKTEGKKLIQDLNSSFAACLLVATISVITMIIISSVANMDISITNPGIVNFIAFFAVCYLLVYSVSILIGIVIDIYNCGQTSLLDE